MEVTRSDLTNQLKKRGGTRCLELQNRGGVGRGNRAPVTSLDRYTVKSEAAVEGTATCHVFGQTHCVKNRVVQKRNRGDERKQTKKFRLEEGPW